MKENFYVNLEEMIITSAAVGWDLVLDCLALNAHQLSVLAAVHAEGVAPRHSGEREQAQAPKDSHASDLLSGDVAGVFAAGRAGRA